jgi:protein-S-isoprenylcysteine O-methyltransferase Ste14
VESESVDIGDIERSWPQRLGARRVAGVTTGDLIARGLIVGLYLVLTRNLLTDFLSTGRITGLLVLVSEFLVVVLTITRRPARTVDLSPASVLTTAVSAVGPLLIRAADRPGVLPDFATTLISGVGLVIIIAGKLALGRSFGIVPANRGVVVSGLYRLVRHPIYAGYVFTHLAFVLAHPTVRNVSVLTLADVALVIRALQEERVLGADREYQNYCRRVPWHFVPGIF